PIPNPEAKTQHGNGTAPGRVWESSTPPPQHIERPLMTQVTRGLYFMSAHTPDKTVSISKLYLYI
ncbi:hypothetical protein, partial [Bifidobacterium sp. W8120]|uniref:hypothetical protein n=1 Tax=Bifidobacterium sp. W8120 TaxID=2750998 RepID=UPI001E502056